MSFYFWETRKRLIGKLAEEISDYYFPLQLVNPGVIADEEGITFNYGNYGNSFDGLLQHQFGNFHIFINLDRLKSPNLPRARYTFAHELAHYYIDDHRKALKDGLVPSHPSFNSMFAKNPVEIEADYFASCLLMPSTSFRHQCNKVPLSSSLINSLSGCFNTSVSSVLFRYFELDMFPMVIICSKNGIVEWSRRSKDFKYWRLPEKGSAIPKSTVAGDFFYQNKRYETTEIVFADDWFLDKKLDSSDQFYEKCYYQPGGTIYSVIWAVEK